MSGLMGPWCDQVGVCLSVEGVDPVDGLLSFDDAGGAILSVLTVMLQQDYSDVLYALVSYPLPPPLAPTRHPPTEPKT